MRIVRHHGVEKLVCKLIMVINGLWFYQHYQISLLSQGCNLFQFNLAMPFSIE